MNTEEKGFYRIVIDVPRNSDSMDGFKTKIPLEMQSYEILGMFYMIACTMMKLYSGKVNAPKKVIKAAFHQAMKQAEKDFDDAIQCKVKYNPK
jgi:hypothetical protein